MDLAHAEISEIAVTGGPVSAFSSRYEALLTSDTMLTWRGNPAKPVNPALFSYQDPRPIPKPLRPWTRCDPHA
jgi:hypothetical protein